MSYSLFILPRTQKELAQLNSGAFARVRGAIRELANDPRPPGCSWTRHSSYGLFEENREARLLEVAVAC